MNLVAITSTEGNDQGRRRRNVMKSPWAKLVRPQDAEQQADAEARQRVEAAQAERVDQILQEADHSATPPSAADPAVAGGLLAKAEIRFQDRLAVLQVARPIVKLDAGRPRRT